MVNFKYEIVYNQSTRAWIAKIYVDDKLLRVWSAVSELKAQILINNWIINETLTG